jgi:ribosomal-protein-alanine N-acetyltransferase
MIVIRPIKTADFDQIAQIEFESFSDPYPRHLFEYLAKTVPDLFLVAIEHKVPVGYIVADVNQITKFSYGHLLSFAVRRDKRHKGIGRRLLTTLIDILRERNCKEVILEVRVSNYSAKTFYQKQGFQVIKRSSKYYEDGEDALIMALSLEEHA